MEFYKASVGSIINLLFYAGRTHIPNTNVAENGKTLHYKLGFTESEKYCRYIPLDDIINVNGYLRLCGSPDRISLEDKLYVDELKTTYSSNKEFAYSVGYAQLQLYMMITGIHDGRVYVYLKDKNTLEYRVFQYDENVAKELIREYLNFVIRQKQIVKGIRSTQ